MTLVEEGWRVPQTTCWLHEDGACAGIGRIRRFLTEKLLLEGGNLSYAILPSARGRGLGRRLLSALLEECREMGMNRVLLTVQKENLPSRKVILANGGVLEKKNKKYLTVPYWIGLWGGPGLSRRRSPDEKSSKGNGVISVTPFLGLCMGLQIPLHDAVFPKGTEERVPSVP